MCNYPLRQSSVIYVDSAEHVLRLFSNNNNNNNRNTFAILNLAVLKQAAPVMHLFDQHVGDQEVCTSGRVKSFPTTV